MVTMTTSKTIGIQPIVLMAIWPESYNFSRINATEKR